MPDIKLHSFWGFSEEHEHEVMPERIYKIVGVGCQMLDRRVEISIEALIAQVNE